MKPSVVPARALSATVPTLYVAVRVLSVAIAVAIAVNVAVAGHASRLSAQVAELTAAQESIAALEAHDETCDSAVSARAELSALKAKIHDYLRKTGRADSVSALKHFNIIEWSERTR
jgi:hypothetical protein